MLDAQGRDPACYGVIVETVITERLYVWFCAMEHVEGLVKLIDWIENIRRLDDRSCHALLKHFNAASAV